MKRTTNLAKSRSCTVKQGRNLQYWLTEAISRNLSRPKSGHYRRSRVLFVPPRQAAITNAALDDVHMWLVLAQLDRRIRSTAARRIKQELRPSD